jgi:REP element-mobilizing transposase RayT
MKPHQPKQLEMTLPTWGGRRPGAGRKPKGPKAGVPHVSRVGVTRHAPVHVTLKLRRERGGMRTKARLDVVRRVFAAGCLREGFRVTDWSLMRDHVHLIVEAQDAAHLAAGIKGLGVRLARGLNRLLGRKGRVLADRYHARVLTTPREVRNALAYVVNNARRHGLAIPRHQADPFSSWASFDGWQTAPKMPPQPEGPAVTARPRSWLRRVGWRRRGLIRVDEVPKGAP